MSKWFTCLAMFLAWAQGSIENARGDSSVIFGMDSLGGLVTLPASLCVSPGQEVRVAADVLDFMGRRRLAPAETFIWRLTRTNGFWEQWDVATSPGFGAFRRGLDLPGSIYFRVPTDIGPGGSLEVIGRVPGTLKAMVRIVDPNSSYPPGYCQWGPAGIYVGAVPPAYVYPCYGQCIVGAICSDGCPIGATCSFFPSGVPYWEVLSCIR